MTYKRNLASPVSAVSFLRGFDLLIQTHIDPTYWQQGTLVVHKGHKRVKVPFERKRSGKQEERRQKQVFSLQNGSKGKKLIKLQRTGTDECSSVISPLISAGH